MSRKGSLGDFLEGSLKEFKRRGRSDSALDRPSAFDKSASASGSSSTAASSARKSIMPLVSRLPSFRRSDGWRQAPSHDKRPLLIMRLSSQSFLDSVVLDDTSKNTLYTMKTEGATTRITRSISATTQFCTIRWPKTLPAIVKGKMATDGVSIHLGDARFIGGENLLKRGPKPDSSRKFNLPNYSQVLKWKRYGNIYWCTTLSVRGPVAVLEMAKDKTPTKLTVYETLHDKYDTKGVLSYHGVYIPLMDYLLVTALLLVTDLQEWMLVKKVEGRNIIVPNPLGQEGSAVETTTSDVQWRKILYREPMYRRLASETSSTYTWFTDSDSTHYPITPTSPRSPHQVYGHPPSAPAGESILSFTDSEYEGDNEEVTVRPISPSMESAFYPSQSDVAPAHGYADPSYHRKSMPPPPVPPLPAQFQGSNTLTPPPPTASPKTRTPHIRVRGLQFYVNPQLFKLQVATASSSPSINSNTIIRYRHRFLLDGQRGPNETSWHC
ncbi:hypothetical protein CC1G_02290 [Coprinopsis cinerea okayama7|uniref:Uncharacterized protein n=1 Tax=Coprinopsis cinerea (strain Okayama-7 / 130 / ATCC MYA-4618 / FGSC 9003) TaxID=240176 RepID=A8N7N3_COPC7|nr:hypothetical protein CC1G_02290 [Coprinopsis cinerea okayama7\|eukprot:XP_001830839.2 hypothetical protein CC1G_02290 [Coprinopsis cinerea okayama7\